METKLLIPGFAIAYHSSWQRIDGNGRRSGGGEITLGPKMVQAADLPPELEQMIEQFLATYEVKRRGLPADTEIVWGDGTADSSPQAFKFQPGNKAILANLVDNPQDNGKPVTIKAHRNCIPNEHNPSGRGYYLNEPIDWADYVYEERLEHDNSDS